MIDYDVVIIGAGPAGLTAGLYAARAGMKALLLEGAVAGGQMLLTEVIENYPGFPQGISGQQLAEQLKSQAVKAGLKIKTEQAEQIDLIQPTEATNWYVVKTEKKEHSTTSIIIASGASPKTLGVPGEEELTGKGVSYCATCDGPLFRDLEIAVVGGGNAAAEEALFLSKFARKIYLIHRRDRLRADKVFQERLEAQPKIDFIWNSRLIKILGEDKVAGVEIEDVGNRQQKQLSCSGVFIFVGLKPATDFVKGLVNLDERGFILTDETLKTSRRGIFACGDCRVRNLNQIVTACGEGAIAAVSCRNYVEGIKGIAYEQGTTFSA